ncbi:Mitochondrial import inner membrane translocase subunit tim22 [Didymella pomorum]
MAFPNNPNGMMAGMNPTAGMSEQEVQMTKMIQASMESCVGKTVMAGVMGGGLGAMFGLFMASMRYDTPMGQPLPTANASPVAGGAASNASTAAKETVAATTAPKATGTPITNAVKAAATNTAASTSTLPTAAATQAISSGGAATAPAATSPFAQPGISDLPLKQQLKHGLRDMYRSSISSGKNFAKVGAIFSGTECAIEGLRAKNDLYNGVAGGCITGGVLARNAGPQAVVVGCAGFAVFSAAIDAYMRMPEDERSKPIA